jgi:hypothetical protein
VVGYLNRTENNRRNMSDTWYDELPEDAFTSETDKLYMEALSRVRGGLSQGLDFDTACSAIDVADEAMKAHIVDDILKVIIAEEHFAKGVSFDALSQRLNVPVERLEKARREMFEDVEKTALKAYHRSVEQGPA